MDEFNNEEKVNQTNEVNGENNLNEEPINQETTNNEEVSNNDNEINKHKKAKYAKNTQDDDTKITKKQIVIVILLLVGLLAIGLLLGFSAFKYNELHSKPIIKNTSGLEENKQDTVQKEIQIFKGDSRPIAVMIDNEKPAWPHAGLNEAYLLYEIIIEGGESRIMALFKGATTKKIGPVRSARHYFLDYAMENDAIYVHFGWSPKAQSNIKKYGINNLNGVTNDGTIFWREGNKNSYHNAFTSIENITKKSEKKEYRTTSLDKGVFTYSADEVLLNTGLSAKTINLKYSGLQNVKYVYNEQTKMYDRYMRGSLHKDRFTDETFTAKNIIVCYIKNGLLDDPENKGRQELYNSGEGEGLYITNGEYINIKWSKSDDKEKTKYYDLNGKEIVLNDGRTWVQIIPIGNKAVIE